MGTEPLQPLDTAPAPSLSCLSCTTTTTQPRLCCHGNPRCTRTVPFSCLLSLINQLNFKTYLWHQRFSSGGKGNCEAEAVPNVFEVNMKSLQQRSKLRADVLSGDLQSGKKLLLGSYTRIMWGHRTTGYSELEGTHQELKDHRVQTEMAELLLLWELH